MAVVVAVIKRIRCAVLAICYEVYEICDKIVGCFLKTLKTHLMKSYFDAHMLVWNENFLKKCMGSKNKKKGSLLIFIFNVY